MIKTISVWNLKNLEKLIVDAVNIFLTEEKSLFEVGVNERSLTHKFAEHLVLFFPGWNIDCEYNRDGEDIKRLIDRRERTYGDDLKAKSVFPDIIIHHRKLRGAKNNLLIIEAKKDANPIERRADINKLSAFKREFNYQFCCFLNFKIKSKKIEYEFV